MKKLKTIRWLDIPLVEWVLVTAVFLTLFIGFAKQAGGPLTSDELHYMELGLTGGKDPMILNYYFHIYFQKLFMELAPSPLVGAKIYWSFLINATGFLVYLSARLISEKTTIAGALMATILYYSSSFIAKYSGITKNDLTAMLLAMLIIFTYLLILKRPRFLRSLCLVAGALLFFALKSKETAFLAGFVLLGLGFDENERFTIKKIAQPLVWLLVGFLIGAFIFILLNGIILWDAFWGMRISDYVNFLSIYKESVLASSVRQNWLSGLVFQILTLPFILYLVSGVKRSKNDLSPAHKMIWTYPALLLVFLTLIMLGTTGFSITDRYFIPAIPILCITAALLFSEIRLESRPDTLKLILAGVLAVLVSFLIHQAVHATYTFGGKFTFLDFYNNITIPILAAALMGLFFFWKNKSKWQSLFLLFLVLLGSLTPLYLNLQSVLVSRPNAMRMQQLFYPFSAFSDDIHFSQDMKLYISPNINKEQLMLLRRVDEVNSMFTIYFHERSNYSNFIDPVKYDPMEDIIDFPDPLLTLPKMDFNYALITATDWERVKGDSALYGALSSAYTITYDDQRVIALLTKK